MSKKVSCRILAATVAVAALSACAGAPTENTTAAPSFAAVTLTNCGEKIEVTTAPKRLITLNQGATEIALSLGLADRMAGTAYLDDQVSDNLRSDYDKVKVLSAKYPTKEEFLAATPDFAYASYSSAFTGKGVGERSELAGQKVGTYLSPFGCPKGTTTAESTFEAGWDEVKDVAAIFGVSDRAATLIANQKVQLGKLNAQAAGKGKKILWYDSGDKTPMFGAGEGGPQLVIDAVGATNIFAQEKDGWLDGSWEKVIADQPDVIVLADASWDTAKKKQEYLESDPTLSKLTAVANKKFIIVPFSHSTPGIHLVDGAQKVAEELSKK